MFSPTEDYLRDRARITRDIKRLGIRPTARKCGLKIMQVHRYVHATGSDDAVIHYTLARTTGRKIKISKGV